MAKTQLERKEEEEWLCLKREDIVLFTSTYRLKLMIILHLVKVLYIFRQMLPYWFLF